MENIFQLLSNPNIWISKQLLKRAKNEVSNIQNILLALNMYLETLGQKTKQCSETNVYESKSVI